VWESNRIAITSNFNLNLHNMCRLTACCLSYLLVDCQCQHSCISVVRSTNMYCDITNYSQLSRAIKNLVANLPFYRRFNSCLLCFIDDTLPALIQYSLCIILYIGADFCFWLSGCIESGSSPPVGSRTKFLVGVRGPSPRKRRSGDLVQSPSEAESFCANICHHIWYCMTVCRDVVL